ncbi:multidrug efflux SMR transporter [Frigidibacter sp.]|uniref:DMT family transporter n=1 Tax=Frigidibacter sp. TaxID=2586418 RepID=UPI0027346698|nr:SMR family transporter [Frigidibacter sp.]MDP3339594.1 SMR family transporter [Frigidibacter sp.]
MKTYIYLLIAVLFETFGTSCLQASQQLTRFWPSVGIVVGFGGAFWFFMQVLKVIPLGVTYALWSGIGIVLISASGYFVFGQKLDLWAVVGIALIIAGIAVINLLSQTSVH